MLLPISQAPPELLLTEILHHLIYRNPRNCGILVVYTGSSRSSIINSIRRDLVQGKG